MTSVNNKSNDPMAALGKLFGSIGNEAGSAVKEAGKLATEDVNSIGKAVETGGFIGGALQFLDVASLGHQTANVADVATGKGALDPKVKEGISAGVNYLTGNPIALKDLFDLFTSPSTPGVKPSAPQQAVPPPDVDQLRGSGNQPKVPGHPERSGFAEDGVGGVETKSYEVNIVEIRGGYDQLVQVTGALDQLRNDPEFAAKYPEAKAALDSDMSMSAQSTVVIMCALRDSPEAMAELQGIADANGVQIGSIDALPPPAAAQPAAPTAPTQAAEAAPPAGGPLDFLGQLGEMFKPIMGILGPAFSILGPLLANPVTGPLIGGAIGTALTAVTGGAAAPLIAALPVVLPMIGMGMTAAGGMMTGAAAGGAPGAPAPAGGDAVAGLLGAGPSSGGITDMLGPIMGLLGAAGGGGALPLPLPA